MSKGRDHGIFYLYDQPGRKSGECRVVLGKHPEFELLDMEQIYPGTQVGDGFFYARLRRIS